LMQRHLHATSRTSGRNATRRPPCSCSPAAAAATAAAAAAATF
jgi:hypothetical protein